MHLGEAFGGIVAERSRPFDIQSADLLAGLQRDRVCQRELARAVPTFGRSFRDAHGVIVVNRSSVRQFGISDGISFRHQVHPVERFLRQVFPRFRLIGAETGTPLAGTGFEHFFQWGNRTFLMTSAQEIGTIPNVQKEHTIKLYHIFPRNARPL